MFKRESVKTGKAGRELKWRMFDYLGEKKCVLLYKYNTFYHKKITS